MLMGRPTERSSMPDETDFDRNPALSENYERAPRWFVPGYDATHAIAAVLLCDRIGEHGHSLVVGAGGGVELSEFARECGGGGGAGEPCDWTTLTLAQTFVCATSVQARFFHEFVHCEKVLLY